MTNQEAEEYANNMTYRDAINNLMKARSIPYRKATFIKVNELLKALSQEPSGDLISRDELLKAMDTWDKFGVDDTNSLFRLDNLSLPNYVPYIHYDDVVKCINGMPSVNQEPKEGHWVYEPQKRMVDETDEGVVYRTEYRCKCSNCDADYGFTKMKDACCRYCGARMFEPQGSEDKG